jgi:AcrR family transcriptional regulator
MARPRDQRKRRAQLVTAAASAVLRHGSAGTRLADIAQEAGLAPASVLYYYPDVRELYTAVFEQGSVQYCEEREAAVSREASAVGKLRACIRSGVPYPGPAQDASRILYELTPIVLRDEAAAAQYDALVSRQAALYEEILRACEESGDFRLLLPAPQLARSFVALEDGYGINVLIGAITADQEEEWLLQYAESAVAAVERLAPAAARS